MAEWRRVDRVEVLEPGSDGRYGGLCPDGYVYNFEVAGTHTYQVADGVVAHNCHELFMHPEYGKEAASLAIRLIKRGRKYGIILLLATQSPTKDSIPRDVTRNISCGVAFSVGDWVANDGLLGQGRYTAGVRATELRMKTDRGTCVTVGITDNTFELIRCYYVPLEDGKDAVTPIIARAMQNLAPRRRPLEVLDAPPDHLGNVAEVLRGEVLRDEATPRAKVVLALLIEAQPAIYKRWTQRKLAEALLAQGAATGTLDGYMVVNADAVHEAMEAREVGDFNRGEDA